MVNLWELSDEEILDELSRGTQNYQTDLTIEGQLRSEILITKESIARILRLLLHKPKVKSHTEVRSADSSQG